MRYLYLGLRHRGGAFPAQVVLWSDTLMGEAPYYIELRGGRFDGFRKGVERMPAETRLTIPTSPADLQSSTAAPCPLAVYERRQVVFALLNGMPTMVLKYDYVGTKATPTGGAATVGRDP